MGFNHELAPEANEWLVLTIGHISLNKFWGETERVRSPLCTSVVISTPAGLVLVDPSVHPPEMGKLLHDAAGLRTEDIRYVFLTHCHGDHYYGLEAFPRAKWLMGEAEIAYWRSRASGRDLELLERIAPAGDEIVPGIRTVHTPGHTPGLTSLLFDWRGRRVAVTGDGVMTEQHFARGEGHSNSVDFDQVRSSIELLRREADIVIPGHGNMFAVEWVEKA